MAFNVPEKYRLTEGTLGTFVSAGNNGIFLIKLSGTNYLQCRASDKHNGWERVSVSIIQKAHSKRIHPVNRAPTNGELRIVREAFWDEPKDVVMVFFPPAIRMNYEDGSEIMFVVDMWRSTGTQPLLLLPEAIQSGN